MDQSIPPPDAPKVRAIRVNDSGLATAGPYQEPTLSNQCRHIPKLVHGVPVVVTTACGNNVFGPRPGATAPLCDAVDHQFADAIFFS